jgi:hypothetical protein
MHDHVYHYDNVYQVFVIDDVGDDLHVMNYVDDDVYEIYNVLNYHDDDDVDDDQVNVNDHHEMIYFNKQK